MHFRERARFVCGKFEAARMLFRGYVRQIPSLGLVASSALFLSEVSTRRPIGPLVKPFAAHQVKIRPAGYEYPISFRRIGTDSAVLRQMLVTREYHPVSTLQNVRLILDCGANIGAAAYYFLHIYPQAKVVAVEPDAENCAMCRRNLAPFGERVAVVQAAVWPDNRRLRIAPSSVQRGSWALAVEPDEEGLIEGLTIPEILRRASAAGPIDLLKVDIEGSETEVFAGDPEWLQHTRNIAIELHGRAAEAVFAAALRNYQYERRRSGELTVVYNLQVTRAIRTRDADVRQLPPLQ